MEDDLPLKLIELTDFLRSPAILSKRLQFKETQTLNLPIKQEQSSSKLKSHEALPGIVLLTQKAISTEENTRKELIVPKDIIIFADDVDRKKLCIFQKSNNYFSRHLLITSGAALQALITPLTNAKEWIIVCKLKYSKRYTRQPSIHGTVVISLNVSHPLVRYELLTALDLLQQSFNEVKSAYIVIDFAHILIRWFKTYLQRTDQYPSFTHRLLYRYQFQTWKCSVTLGKRKYQQDNEQSHLTQSLQKILHKSDHPMQIYIDFSSLPTNVYSIELNNVFIYSINDDHKQVVKEMGNGLSLISIQDLHSSKDRDQSRPETFALVKKSDMTLEKSSVSQQHDDELLSTYEPNEQERVLFEKLWDNRLRIQMQHQQLMFKAARLICFPPVIPEPANKKTDLTDLQAIKHISY